MKTTNPFIASVSDQSGEMVELIPQDSQTLTADYVQVRRDDLEFAVSVLDIATAWADDPSGRGLEAYLRLRAALNQGQG